MNTRVCNVYIVYIIYSVLTLYTMYTLYSVYIVNVHYKLYIAKVNLNDTLYIVCKMLQRRLNNMKLVYCALYL